MATQDGANRGLHLPEIMDGWRQLHGLGNWQPPAVVRPEWLASENALLAANAATTLYDLISDPSDFTSESWHCAAAVLSEAMKAKSNDPAVSADLDATRAVIAETSALIDLSRLALTFVHDVAQRLGARAFTQSDLERCQREGGQPPAMPGFIAGHELLWFWPEGDPDELARQWNEAVAAAICGVGPNGADVAKRLREINADHAGGRLWQPWNDFDDNRPGMDTRPSPDGVHVGNIEIGPPGAPLTVPMWWVACTRAIWRDGLLVELTARLERTRRQRPAVIRSVLAEQLLPTMSRQLQLPAIDDPGIIRDAKGREIGRVALMGGATVETVFRGLDLLGSVHGHRLIRALVLGSHDAWVSEDPHFFRVAFEGGWSGLAEAIGYKTRNFEVLKQLAHAGQCVQWEHKHGRSGGLWTWRERRGSWAAPGEVAFNLSDVMLPGHAATMAGQSDSARMARRLVPELREAPPVSVARPNEQGGVWTLHRIMLVELVDQAEHMARDGGAVLKGDWWRLKAKAAGLPTAPDYIDRVRGSWLAGDDDAPPLLEQVGCDRYTLASSHLLERLFIEEGGRRRIEGRANGRGGKRAKASKASKGTP